MALTFYHNKYGFLCYYCFGESQQNMNNQANNNESIRLNDDNNIINNVANIK